MSVLDLIVLAVGMLACWVLFACVLALALMTAELLRRRKDGGRNG